MKCLLNMSTSCCVDLILCQWFPCDHLKFEGNLILEFSGFRVAYCGSAARPSGTPFVNGQPYIGVFRLTYQA